jgi:hypothetical protein
MVKQYIITVSKSAPEDLKCKEFPNWAMSYNECERYLHRLPPSDQMWFHILPLKKG